MGAIVPWCTSRGGPCLLALILYSLLAGDSGIQSSPGCQNGPFLRLALTFLIIILFVYIANVIPLPSYAVSKEDTEVDWPLEKMRVIRRVINATAVWWSPEVSPAPCGRVGVPSRKFQRKGFWAM